MGWKNTDQVEDGYRCVTTYEYSTVSCPCGASFTWDGIDPRLDEWKEKHRPHLKPQGSALPGG
jgi:hypothetical protein